MDQMVVDGVKPWDGRYQFDVAYQELTTREWGWVKRLTGYMPLTIEQGLAGADPELLAVFAAIALRRAGKITADEVPAVYERFVDLPPGVARYETEPAEDGDAGPPAGSSNGSSSTSGDDSPTSSASSDATTPATGTRDWATSVSAPTISAT
jgi:hypothetical protein